MTSHRLLIAAAALLVVALLLRWRAAVAGLRRFLLAPTHPINLAVARIATFGALLGLGYRDEYLMFSGLPAVLRFPVPGLRWATPHLTFGAPSLQAGIGYLFLIVCLFGLVGLFTRIAVPLALVVVFYVLGVPEFYGAIYHYHHLVWFLALLAVSPCGDALSLDAWIDTRRRPDPANRPTASVIYGLPIRFIWLLMGVIYLFPGFWKLWSCGTQWFRTDALRNILYAKWLELGGWTPFFRIDRYHRLCEIGGMATMLFELSFFFLIFDRRTRLLAAVGGLLFHTMNGLFLQIPFWMLQPYYLTFIDWHAVLARPGKHSESDTPRRSPQRERSWCTAIATVGTVLLAANVVCGIRHISSWPFACYPTFDSLPPARVDEIFLEVDRSGTKTWIDPYQMPMSFAGHSDRLGAMMGMILSDSDRDRQRERLKRFAAIFVPLPPTPGISSVGLWRVNRSTIPGDGRVLEQTLVLRIGPGGDAQREGTDAP